MIDETHHLQVSHEHEVQISCSIGISIAPIDGRDFTCLFQKADQALYQAKSDGKNQCVIYDEKNISAYLMNSVPCLLYTSGISLPRILKIQAISSSVETICD